jgi:hypothetical protein
VVQEKNTVATALSSGTGDRPAGGPRELVQHLRRGELDDVKRIFAAVAMSPEDLQDSFSFLERKFGDAEQLNLLLELLLSNSDTTFTRVGLVGRIFALAGTLDRPHRVQRTISRMRASPTGAIFYWGYEDRLRSLRKLGTDVTAFAGKLKYGSVQPFDVAKVFDLSRRFASRLVLPQGLTDNLYRHTRSQLPRDEWEQQVKAAYCLDHITDDMKRIRGRAGLLRQVTTGLIDKDARKRALDQIDPSKGTILMTFHGGFQSVAIAFYAETFENGVVIKKKASKTPGKIGVKDNARAALFAAMRELQDRKVMLIAVDGSNGGTAFTMSVLGKPVEVGIGAAFLAYEVRCNTAWFTMVQKDDGFVPVILPGPVRIQGESFDQFKERLFGFVAEQIESLVTGDPRNIALHGKWTNLLRGASTSA